MKLGMIPLSKFTNITIIMIFLSVAFFITVKYSSAEHTGFRIGPDGNAYKLIDCSIPENNEDPSKCFNTTGPLGRISWESARERALEMTFDGFPCDLATPSTERVNDFLKDFPGFLDACNDCGEDFELCAYIGAQHASGLPLPPGPYRFVNDPNNDIPCPFAGDCTPVVIPSLDTNLTFQDWCRESNGCPANEPNGQEYMVYLSYLNIDGPVAWADCTNSSCPNRRCQPLSYFVQCNVPPPDIPTLSEWGLIAMAGILGIVGFMIMRRRNVNA